MKSFLIGLALIAATSATFTFQDCMDIDPALCEACPEANEKDAGVTKQVKNETTSATLCMCVCGIPEGEECERDEQCEIGTHCGAPSQLETMNDKTKGICSSNCENSKCPQYFFCNKNRECDCVTYPCSASFIKQITARRQTGPDGVGATYETQTFLNSCQMVNANCLLWRDDPNARTWDDRITT